MRINYLFFLLLLTGCVTLQEVKYGELLDSFENENIKISLVGSDNKSLLVNIQNKTNSVIELVTDQVSFSFTNGENVRLVPSNTLYIDVTRSQPNIMIPPMGQNLERWYSSRSAKFNGKEWVVSPWVPRSLTNVSITFGYKINNESSFGVIGKGNLGIAQSENTPIGSVKVDSTFWNILFLYPVKARRDALYKRALEVAKAIHGENIQLRNLKYSGYWNPMSLILYFSMLGFVESAELSADVYRNSF